MGHVERMTNERVAKTIQKWKPYATRPKGRPRVRWEDDVRNDLRKMGVSNWKQRAQERKQWKEVIEQAKTHRVVELKEEEEVVVVLIICNGPFGVKLQVHQLGANKTVSAAQRHTTIQRQK